MRTRAGYEPTVTVEEALLDIASRSGLDLIVHRRTDDKATDWMVNTLNEAGLVTGTKRNDAALTASGEELLERISKRRHQEDEGRPLAEWDPLRAPKQRQPEEFESYAIRNAITTHGGRRRTYHTDGNLMLLGAHPNPELQVPEIEPQDANGITDPDLWTAVRIEPIGYLFEMKTAAIAFSCEDVYLDTTTYETILARTDEPREWYALTRIDETPRKDHKDTKPTMVRCDAAGTVGAAWCSVHKLEKRTPSGIRRLLQQQSSSGFTARRRAS